MLEKKYLKLGLLHEDEYFGMVLFYEAKSVFVHSGAIIYHYR